MPSSASIIHVNWHAVKHFWLLSRASFFPDIFLIYAQDQEEAKRIFAYIIFNIKYQRYNFTLLRKKFSISAQWKRKSLGEREWGHLWSIIFFSQFRALAPLFSVNCRRHKCELLLVFLVAEKSQKGQQDFWVFLRPRRTAQTQIWNRQPGPCQ